MSTISDHLIEKAARAETEALVDDIIHWDDTTATDGPCDGTWDSLAAHLTGRGWARTHLTTQEESVLMTSREEMISDRLSDAGYTEYAEDEDGGVTWVSAPLGEVLYIVSAAQEPTDAADDLRAEAFDRGAEYGWRQTGEGFNGEYANGTTHDGTIPLTEALGDDYTNPYKETDR